MSIKRGLLVFWALWYSIVLMTNATDGLKAFSLLPEMWVFASGNYAFIAKVVSIYHVPEWLAAALFITVLVWEVLAAILFWHSVARFSEARASGPTTVDAAFAVSLGLWAAFIIADEIFVVYRTTSVEVVHMGIFTAQLMTLLAIRLLPDDSLKPDRA